jgi:hypothetical protein
MLNNEKTKLSFEHYGMKFSVEMPGDSNYSEVMEAFDGLMIAAGYSRNWLLEFCKQYVEQNELTDQDND